MAQDWLFVSEDHMMDLRVAGVLIHQGKLLVQREINGSVYALPGGHVQAGESLEAALLRELREEAGVSVVCERMLWSEECFWRSGGRQAHTISFYYRIKAVAAFPMALPSFPHRDNARVLFEWLALDDVPHVTLYPSFLKHELHRLHEPMRHFISYD